MDVKIPEASLVVLCGIAGCGKSTFAGSSFKQTEIVSSDRCRAIISDDEGNMEISKDAFELFHFIIGKRMKAGKLVVADSTAVSYEARKRLLHIAHDNDYHVILLVFDVPLEKAYERNKMRDRQVPEKVIENQYFALKKSLKNINKEGFDEVIILEDDDIKNVSCAIVSSNMPNNEKIASGMVSNINKSSQHLIIEKVNTEELVKPLSFKSRDGYGYNFSKEEIRESIKQLSLQNGKLPWITYIPPLLPCLSSGDLISQVQRSVKYYFDRGMYKCIIEGRKQNQTYTFVICKDKDCSCKHFSGDKIGEVYSLNSSSQIEEQDRNEIINILYDDLIKSGYFEQHNNDFIIFEALINYDGADTYVVPVKVIANSRMSFLSKDNLWQNENIDKMSRLSAIIKKSESILLDNKNYRVLDIDRFISSGEYNSIVVKPVKVPAKYNEHILQPEIMCSEYNGHNGEEYFKLSTLAHELCYETLEMFVKNKFSKKYLEFLLGCVTINNRMLRMRV